MCILILWVCGLLFLYCHFPFVAQANLCDRVLLDLSQLPISYPHFSPPPSHVYLALYASMDLLETGEKHALGKFSLG